MGKPFAGKKWFYALGQSTVRWPWHLVKSRFGLYALPKWAQQAFAAGRMGATSVAVADGN